MVYTLDSGATGAGSSAFQCFKQHRDNCEIDHQWKDKSHHGDFEHVSDEIYKNKRDNSLFRQHNYWKTAERELVGDANEVKYPEFVVEDYDGSLRNLDGGQLAMNVRKSEALGENGNPILELTKDEDSVEQVCYKVEGHKGYAAYIGHTEKDDSIWMEDGFHPREEMVHRLMGEKQMVSPSCLNSIMHSKTQLIDS
jgi:hypothetical protein